MTATDHTRIKAALATVDRETQYVQDERAAFDRFRARLSDIDPTPVGRTGTGAATGGGVGTTTVGTAVAGRGDPGPSRPLRRVRAAYCETVMAVPHYESEYGDTLRENLAAEFGPEVASQVVDGTSLTPPLYRALVAGSESASDDRDQFRRSLDRERESVAAVRDGLADCRDRLAGIEQTIDGAPTATLSRLDDRLAALEATCGDLADERQRLVHGRSNVPLSGVSGVSLTTFLYGDRETQCPALAAIADCLDRIRDARERCLR